MPAGLSATTLQQPGLLSQQRQQFPIMYRYISAELNARDALETVQTPLIARKCRCGWRVLSDAHV
jgi:hypothetical protein